MKLAIKYNVQHFQENASNSTSYHDALISQVFNYSIIIDCDIFLTRRSPSTLVEYSMSLSSSNKWLSWEGKWNNGVTIIVASYR